MAAERALGAVLVSDGKGMFESNWTRQAFRAAFAAYSPKVAIDKVDEFYSSWKEPPTLLVLLLLKEPPTLLVLLTGRLTSTP